MSTAPNPLVFLGSRPDRPLLIPNWPAGEVLNTKEVAAAIGLSTAKAYALLVAEEARGNVCAHGYRVSPGVWEDRAHSSRQCAGLYWQRN